MMKKEMIPIIMKQMMKQHKEIQKKAINIIIVLKYKIKTPKNYLIGFYEFNFYNFYFLH